VVLNPNRSVIKKNFHNPHWEFFSNLSEINYSKKKKANSILYLKIFTTRLKSSSARRLRNAGLEQGSQTQVLTRVALAGKNVPRAAVN